MNRSTTHGNLFRSEPSYRSARQAKAPLNSVHSLCQDASLRHIERLAVARHVLPCSSSIFTVPAGLYGKLTY